MSRALLALVACAGCDVVFRIDRLPQPPGPIPIIGRWAQVDGGDAHTCAIDDQQHLWCWGRNNDGEVGAATSATQIDSPRQLGDATWAAVDATVATTCGLQTNGTAWCWGWNGFGQLGDGSQMNANAPKQLPDMWHAIAVGREHACGIKTDRTLWCWGRGDAGQLGTGQLVMATLPTLTAEAGPWQRVAVGWRHTCAIKMDGTLWCWGDNATGAVGDVTLDLRSKPIQVGTETWRAVDAGDGYTCAIATTDRLRCWGYNEIGVLGDGSQQPQLTPTAVIVDGDERTDWLDIVASAEHTCGLTRDGRLFCWGSSLRGHYGLDGTYASSFPHELTGPHPWLAIGTGQAHTCAIAIDRTMYCLGADGWSQLADGGTSSNTPIKVDGSWQQVDTGELHTCAVATNGVPHCAGFNRNAMLGTGKRDSHATLTAFDAVPTWTVVATGYRHSCGVRAGMVACWGTNEYGQLGNGATNGADVLSPQTIVAGSNVTTFYNHTCSIDDTNFVSCWGLGDNGQIGRGSLIQTNVTPYRHTTRNYRAVGAGLAHTCAIAAVSPNTVYCWGDGEFGQIGNGTNPTALAAPGTTNPAVSAAQLAVGGFHNCAIRGDGSAVCWGHNGFGQLGVGDIMHRNTAAVIAGTWSSIALGYFHSCGIRTDRTLWCWGNNERGQLGDGTRADRNTPVQVGAELDWASVAPGWRHTCATKLDGSLWCWGDNDHAELASTAWRGPWIQVP